MFDEHSRGLARRLAHGSQWRSRVWSSSANAESASVAVNTPTTEPLSITTAELSFLLAISETISSTGAEGLTE